MQSDGAASVVCSSGLLEAVCRGCSMSVLTTSPLLLGVFVLPDRFWRVELGLIYQKEGEALKVRVSVSLMPLELVWCPHATDTVQVWRVRIISGKRNLIFHLFSTQKNYSNMSPSE